MPVDMPLDTETIGLVRRGSDIDVQAIFGGNIAGRRLTGVKINPLFLEGHSEEDVRQTESLGRNGSRRKDPAIRLNVYDLRSPAHNSNGENGKRHTIVRIGGHEVISLSSDNGNIDNSDVPESNLVGENVTAFLPDVDVNIEDTYSEANHTNRQTQKDSAFVSSLPGSDLSDYRTNVSPLRLNGGTNYTCRYVTSGDVNNSRFIEDDKDPGSKDVREVVVKFTETVETPVMETPHERCEWPDIPDGMDHDIDNKLSPSDCEDKHLNPGTDKHVDFDSISAPELTNHSSSHSGMLKPILVRSQSSFDTLISSSGSSHVIIEELSKSNTKTVKFAEDTIDNENKTKRYVKERIDLSQVHKDQPLEIYGSINAGFVGDVENVNNNHTASQVDPHLLELNIPAYMQKYLVEGQAGQAVREDHKTTPPVGVPSVVVTVSTEQPAEYEESPGDTSQDTEMSEIPGYTAMVMKSAMQERRKQAVKWTIITVVVVVLIVLAIALPIYFTSR